MPSQLGVACASCCPFSHSTRTTDPFVTRPVTTIESPGNAELLANDANGAGVGVMVGTGTVHVGVGVVVGVGVLVGGIGVLVGGGVHVGVGVTVAVLVLVTAWVLDMPRPGAIRVIAGVRLSPVGVSVTVGVFVGNKAMAVAVAAACFFWTLAGRKPNHHTDTPTTAKKASAQGTISHGPASPPPVCTPATACRNCSPSGSRNGS